MFFIYIVMKINIFGKINIFRIFIVNDPIVLSLSQKILQYFALSFGFGGGGVRVFCVSHAGSPEI